MDLGGLGVKGLWGGGLVWFRANWGFGGFRGFWGGEGNLGHFALREV